MLLKQFQVSLSHHPVDVGHLSLNDLNFDTISFRYLLMNSNAGKLMFQINQSVTVHQDHCIDPEGCVCGNQV